MKKVNQLSDVEPGTIDPICAGKIKYPFVLKNATSEAKKRTGGFYG